MADQRGTLAPYVARTAAAWLRDSPEAQHVSVDATLLMADVSGFTRLSERLAQRGRIGAEEVSGALTDVFTELIGRAADRGGDVIAFGGDALLIVFAGEGHTARGASAALEMQRALDASGRLQTSAGPITLRMTAAIASGPVLLLLVGGRHRQLLAVGPVVDAMVAEDAAASPGDVAVDEQAAARLDPSWVVAGSGGGRLLRRTLRPPPASGPAAEDPRTGDVSALIPRALRPHLGTHHGGGAHRVATVAFVAFSGVHRVLAGAGPDELAARTARLLANAEEACERHSVALLATDVARDGGKLVLAAGAPLSAGDDEERMLLAVCGEIHREDVGLTLRTGVNRGPVFAGDVGAPERRVFTAMGDTTNLAARLSPARRRRLDPRRSRGAGALPHEVRGGADAAADGSRARPAPWWPNAWASRLGVRADETTGSTRRSSTAWPRWPRWPTPWARRGATAPGRRSSWSAIRGSASRGCSRSSAARARGASRARARSAFSVQHTGVPYAAMRPALRALAAIPEDADERAAGAAPAGVRRRQVAPRLLPWLPLIAIPFGAHAEPTPQAERVSEAFRRDRMHDAVHALLTATLDTPALFVLEDAHLADDASLALCRRIADAPDRPWLVAASRRPYGQPAVPDSATRLTLRPLPAEDIALLASAVADRPLPDDALAAIARRSGGNPLAAAELAREVASGGSAGELPDSVEALVAARLDSLEADDALLLRVASVLGRRFELDVLRELVAEEQVDVDDLARWKRLSEFVVWEGMDELAFRHDVYVDTAYAGLSYRRRRALHARAAEALESRRAEGLPVDHGVLALHFQHGGRHAEAWRTARLAGEAARAVLRQRRGLRRLRAGPRGRAGCGRGRRGARGGGRSTRRRRGARRPLPAGLRRLPRGRRGAPCRAGGQCPTDAQARRPVRTGGPATPTRCAGTDGRWARCTGSRGTPAPPASGSRWSWPTPACCSARPATWTPRAAPGAPAPRRRRAATRSRSAAPCTSSTAP